MSALTAEYIRSILDYEPSTGVLTWRKRQDRNDYWNRRYSGKQAGSSHKDGYLRFSINKKNYLAHRIAYLHFHGIWPSDEIDHINGIANDNRIENLRAVTSKQNNMNTRLYKNNTTGLKGVSWSKSHVKWSSTGSLSGKTYNIGYFDCPAAAHLAYVTWADKHFGEFARFN